MMDSKPRKQPKPKSVVGPKSASTKVAMMPDTFRSQDMIRERAYELYQSRGREPGQDEQDWLRAEQEILKQER